MIISEWTACSQQFYGMLLLGDDAIMWRDDKNVLLEKQICFAVRLVSILYYSLHSITTTEISKLQKPLYYYTNKQHCIFCSKSIFPYRRGNYKISHVTLLIWHVILSSWCSTIPKIAPLVTAKAPMLAANPVLLYFIY